MLAIGGVILIGSAFYVGMPGDFDIERISSGQVLLLGGVVLMTLSITLSRHFMTIFNIAVPAIGLAVLVLYGINERDVVGAAGGVAILAAGARNMIKAKKR